MVQMLKLLAAWISWSSCRQCGWCVVVPLWSMLWSFFSFFIIYFSLYGLTWFFIIWGNFFLYYIYRNTILVISELSKKGADGVHVISFWSWSNSYTIYRGTLLVISELTKKGADGVYVISFWSWSEGTSKASSTLDWIWRHFLYLSKKNSRWKYLKTEGVYNNCTMISTTLFPFIWSLYIAGTWTALLIIKWLKHKLENDVFVCFLSLGRFESC
jgi:hypothetical protein